MAELFGASPDIDLRKKWAMLQLQAGSDASPVRHPLQAVARALQGAMGGYIAGQDRQDQQDSAADLAKLIGGQQPGAPLNIVPQTTQPAPQTAAPTAPNRARATATMLAKGADEETPAGTPQEYINRAWGGLTPQGRDVATKTVLGEAGNQGQLGMDAVADVMRNRAVNGGYGGNTMDAVALAKGQFEPWMTQGGRNRMAGYAPESTAYKNAQSSVDGAAIGGRPDATGGAQYFYAPQAQQKLASLDGRPVVPSFAAGRQPTAVIGDHNFYAGRGQPQAAPQPQEAPPQQVAQAPQQAPQPDVSQQPAQPDMKAQVAEMLRSPNPYTQRAGQMLATQLLQKQLSPPEFKQVGQTVLGQPQYGWVDPNKKSVEPIGGTAGSQGGAPSGSDPSFQRISEAAAKGAPLPELYQHVPIELRGAVQSVIEGRGVPANIGSRGPARTATMLYAHAIDPSFDEGLIPQRMTFARSMGSTAPSAVGGQKILLGTSLGHLADLSEDAVKLGNVNGMGSADLAHASNFVKNRTTSNAAIALSLEDKAQKFSGEVGKLYSGSSGGGVHEREETRSRMGANKSPEELASGLEANRDLILSKLTALEEMRNQAYGQHGKNIIEFRTKEVERNLAKIDTAISNLRGKGGGDAMASGGVDPAAMNEARRRGLIP